MSERFFKPQSIPPEEGNASVGGAGKDLERRVSSPFDGFLDLLRSKGVRVSAPEWLQFLQIIREKAKAESLGELVGTNELLNKVRLFAQATLVKDKADEAAFHEAFEEYFELLAQRYGQELGIQKEEEKKKEEAREPEAEESAEPDIKEKLGIQEVDENLDLPEGEHEDNEQVHGGKEDQHNDILRKADLSKQGGGEKEEGSDADENTDQPGEGEGDEGEASAGEGDQGELGAGQGGEGEAGAGEGDKGEAGKGQGDKGEPSGMGKGGKEDQPPGMPPHLARSEQQQLVQEGVLVGGGIGKSIYAKRADDSAITHEGEKISRQHIQEREERAGKRDRRHRYEVRPDKASTREVVRNLRRIITDVSEVKSSSVNLRGTVRNFARRDFRFEYGREREKQPEIVLLIDVGGPVDEWSPLMKEVTEEMAKGLTKLEVYLFHNNIYGYVWKPDPKDLLASSHAQPNSLIDVRKIIKKRKKVIIYGDAKMSYSEFRNDLWPPRGNRERLQKFGMEGDDCLRFIKKKADAVVWINPLFSQKWENMDDSGTIEEIGEIIPMHDLTVGGVEDAVKELMKR